MNRIIPALAVLPALAGAVISAPAVLANEGAIAFVGATIIDGTDAAPLPDGALVIADGRIRAIGPRGEVGLPPGARVVDVSGRYIMPGLVNAHGHVGGTLGLEGGHYNTENLIRQLALYARYGVTAVNSLGGDAEQGAALRDAQSDRGLDRARLYVAGRVVAGGSEREVRGEVNRNADMGADFIKIRLDDNLGAARKMPRPLFEAAVDQARIRRLPVAAHLFYLEDAKYVLDAGVGLIAHSIRDLPVDGAFIEQLRVRDACYVPTLTREVSTFVYERVPDFFSDPYFRKEADPAVLEALSAPERMSRVAASPAARAYKAALEVALANVGALHRAGARIAMGTDTGPPARFQGYFEHMEMQLMADAGMAPADVIRAATGVAAACIGAGDIGTLEPGKWGDFSVLAADPAADIANTRTIESVWIAGNRVPD